MVRCARRPSTLIAARRLADNPKSGFRAVSGVVLALFVASVAISSITALEAADGTRATGPAAGATLVQDLIDFRPPGIAVVPRAIPASLVPDLDHLEGVRRVIVVHVTRTESNPYAPVPELISCADLRRSPGIGRCAPGASVADVTGLAWSKSIDVDNPAKVWAAAAVSASALTRMPVELLLVSGSPGGIEQARTVLERAFPHRFTPLTIREDDEQRRSAGLIKQYRQLVDAIVLASLPIAGCSLAVSVVAGIGERRRAFSVLRLSGTPLSVLRRVIALESAVPLLLLASASIATGFLTAALFLRSQLDEAFVSPPVSFYLTVAGGLLASFAIIATTLPLLRRTTGPEVARND